VAEVTSKLKDRRGLIEIVRVLATRRMLVALLMGFSSGLPLWLTITLLQAWLTLRGVSIAVIGLFALVGLPYTFKFVWSPIFDRYRIPILGRRRGWLFILQIITALAIAGLGLVGVPDATALNTSAPARLFAASPFVPPIAAFPAVASHWIGALGGLLPGLTLTAIVAFLVAFFSASQDIMIDAYRRESLGDDKEQSLGASLYVWGYRFAMLFTSGIGLILAFHIPFSEVFYIMAASMGVGIAATLIAREPAETGAAPRTLAHAVIDPFVAFFKAHRRTSEPHASKPSTPPLIGTSVNIGKIYWPAMAILAFILLYKLGDALASSLITAFLVRLGFNTQTIGAVTKLFGFWATIGGVLVGGMVILKFGMLRGLFICGVLQGAATASFAWLTHTGPDPGWLAGVVSLAHFTDGMGTAALVGFMATMTDRRFTVTQFALLTALSAVPRVIISSFTGYMADALGWAMFFIVCALAAIPGLLLIPFLHKGGNGEAGVHLARISSPPHNPVFHPQTGKSSHE
jgi:PAT family beta-lactamase induction signal transducer AmpG